VKKCGKCQTLKSLQSFAKDKQRKDGLTCSCKSCRNPQAKTWRDKNPKRVKEINDKSKQNRKEYYDNPERKLKNRSRELEKRLGITHTEYESILASQGGVCAICKRYKITSNNKYMAIDHCHSTLKIRGVLCNWCNRALGLLEDNIEFFNSAIKYLENNKKEL